MLRKGETNLEMGLILCSYALDIIIFFAGCQGLNSTHRSVSPLFRGVKLVSIIFSGDTGKN